MLLESREPFSSRQSASSYQSYIISDFISVRYYGQQLIDCTTLQPLLHKFNPVSW